MDYGIIGAMDEEISYLKSKMNVKKEYVIANSIFIEGTLATKNIVLLKSGIGKVNAAMTTTILMEKFSPKYIINTGSAGSLTDQLQVGDIVIAEELVHHDVDATAFNYKIGQVPQLPTTYRTNEQLKANAIHSMRALSIPYKTGLIATGDSFMSDVEKTNQIRQLFPDTLAVEMEGAAIAQVCYQYDAPFIVIRSLSDIAGKQSAISFDKFLQIAAKNSAKLIINMLKNNN